MLTEEIRNKFLKYFQEKGHTLVPSSPVIPHDDPTLLFVNAGMNQFKDVFLGKSKRDYTRAVTSQKCIRVGGKHNDLENVGHTKRHLTFFEMLGNFSFGDYFKKEAIQFAWEVVTEVFEFDPEKLWATVLHNDDEAYDLWKTYLPESRIARMGEKDNFWAMGETGPCGPCSEILYDRGSKYGDAKSPVDDELGERYLEVWNLVFMQFNRDEKKNMTPLPRPSIDTGAGLERIISLKLDVDNVFQTDVLQALIKQVETISKVSYNEKQAPAFHVIADHIRCLSFAIADGAQPSNVGRGYVLRKILRRAVRYGKMLGFEKPFMAKVFPTLIETMGDHYPELKTAKKRISEILTIEEEAFLKTLKRGGSLLNQVIESAKKHQKVISGEDAFKLKDTYGMPLEEIELLAKDAGLSIDMERYIQLEKEAKERSRASREKAHQIAEENLFADFAKSHNPCTFAGYDQSFCEAKVIGLVKNNAFVDEIHEGDEAIIILDTTPFYAEKGGQVADIGTIKAQGKEFVVNDCQEPFKGVIAHLGKLTLGSLKKDETILASIDKKRRQKIANNHTATHLLHWALHKILGEHIKQAGSVVEPSRLRFDFSHHKALSKEEIVAIEMLVNEKIRENIDVKKYVISYEQAQKDPTIKQFFGDKYGSQVRVVDIDFSKELCGGTHTSRLGNIGYFRITKEGSIAAGIRRIEAVTGKEAEEFAYTFENTLEEIASLLKTQNIKVKDRVLKLIEENKQLTQKLNTLQKKHLEEEAKKLFNDAEKINNTLIIVKEIALPLKDLRVLSDALQSKISSGVLCLGAKEGTSCQIIAKVSEDLISKGIKANELIKSISPIIKGGGGGKPAMAQAGGKDPNQLNQALLEAKKLIEEKLK